MVINWTRYDAAGKRVVVVVQRGLLLVDGLVEHVHVEGHLGDVQLGQASHLLSSVFERKFVALTHFDLI